MTTTHTRRFARSLALIVLAVLLPSCGSMAVTRRAADDTTIDGLRVQVPEPHRVVAVFLDHGGKLTVKETTASLPAPDEHYDVDFTGALFYARSLDVDIENGMLKSYAFKNESNLGEALATTAEGTGEIVEALEQRANAEASEPDPVVEANTRLEQEIRNIMLQANLQALQAGNPLPYPQL